MIGSYNKILLRECKGGQNTAGSWWNYSSNLLQWKQALLWNTGLLKVIVRILTTFHTQYTWDSSICICLFNRTTLQVFVTYLTGALYVHPLWFYKHQHDNRIRSTQNAFSLPFAAILGNCAPSGEMHNYLTPHTIKENWEFLDPSVLLHTPISSVLCMTSC